MPQPLHPPQGLFLLLSNLILIKQALVYEKQLSNNDGGTDPCGIWQEQHM